MKKLLLTALATVLMIGLVYAQKPLGRGNVYYSGPGQRSFKPADGAGSLKLWLDANTNIYSLSGKTIFSGGLSATGLDINNSLDKFINFNSADGLTTKGILGYSTGGMLLLNNVTGNRLVLLDDDSDPSNEYTLQYIVGSNAYSVWHEGNFDPDNYALDGNVVHITGDETVAGNKTYTGTVKITGGSPGAGKVLTSDAAGLADWQSETDPKRVSSLAISGSSTKTVTLTLADASTVSNIFTDNTGPAYSGPVELKDFIADAANSGTDLTGLFTYAVAPNQLNINGQKITAIYGGKSIGSSTPASSINPHYAAYFQGNTIFDYTTVISLTDPDDAVYWEVSVLIIRTSSTTAKATVKFTSSNNELVVKETDLTIGFSSSATLTLNGQSTGGFGAGSNQIIAKLGNIKWWPAVTP